MIGAGLLGCVTALLLARAGARVTLLDRRPAPCAGASAINEGKVHLGIVFALGDRATDRVMVRGALAFAPVLERALGARPDWRDLCSDPFTYLVMPDSMATPGELGDHYRRLNDLAGGVAGARYLGAPLARVADTVPHRDPATGLPAFRTAELAVDPVRLGAAVAAAVAAEPAIDLRVGATVTDVDPSTGAIRIAGEADGEGHAAVVNCAWEGRSRIAAASGARHPAQNVRVKAMVRLAPAPGHRTITLVQGPYGDTVTHRGYTYASWYPAGRAHQEEAAHVSDAALAAVDAAGASASRGAAQVRALADLGLLRGDEEVTATGAGVILGDGRRDIDDRASGLHRRGAFGALAHGRLVTPLNFKLTTAPLAAERACTAALAVARARR